MKRFLAALAFVFAASISAQTVTVPNGTTYQVNLTWTGPSGCTATAPCTYAVYRVPGTVTITAGTTGATLVTTTAAQTTAASDTTVASGNTYSYAVETIQGGANSVPSNTFTISIPLAPAAPAGLSGSVGP
jgi:hypothetical protein